MFRCPLLLALLSPAAGFGDKLSPVSDSTNMAALAAGVNLYSHIGHLLWTTGPGFIICCVVYSYMGMGIDASSSAPANITNLMNAIGQIYHFNILLLLPPIIVLYGSLSKRPPIPMLFFIHNSLDDSGISLSAIYRIIGWRIRG
ncbi:Sodium/proton antiporter [Citrobacter braakii]|nr:Sodium/proton antiporter [Citrobacter braakii]